MFVYSAAAASADNNTVTTAPIDTTGADMLILFVSCGNLSLSFVTDSVSNNWSGAISEANTVTNAPAAGMFILRGFTTSSSYTVTYTQSGCFPAILILAVSGSVASPNDQNSLTATVTSGTSLAAGSVTPSQGGELITTVLGTGGSSQTGIGIDSGFTLLGSVNYTSGTGHSYGLGAAYLIKGSSDTTAVNPNWSWTSSSNGVAAIVTLKGTYSAAAAPVWWPPAEPMQSRSSRRYHAALAGLSLELPTVSSLRPPIYGYEFTSPPLVSRQRNRVAGMFSTGLFRSETSPSGLPTPVQGYEYVTPPLVTRQRARIAAQVATGVSRAETQPGDLRAPQYGYEPTSPPLVTVQRSRVAAMAAAGLSRSETQAGDIQPPQYGYELTSPPLTTRRRTQVAVSFPDISLVQSSPSDLLPPQYGYEYTTPPLVRNRAKPDLPIPLLRQDSDVATAYGYEFISPPLVRNRLKPDLPIPLGRQDADRSPQYGYELTSPPLVTRQRTQVAVTFPDISLVQSRPSDLLQPQYGYELASSPLVRNRPKPDLPVPAPRLDGDGVPQYGYELATPPLLTRRRTQVGVSLPDVSLVESQPSDLFTPLYGYEVVSPALVRARRRPDLPVPSPRLDGDAAPQYGYEPTSPALVTRQRTQVAVSFPDISLVQSQPSDLAPPSYGYELASPALVRNRPKPDLPTPLSRLDGDPLPQYGYELSSPPLVTPLRSRVAVVFPDLLLVQSRPADLLPPNYGYELTSPPLVRACSRLDLPAALARQDADLSPVYGYEPVTPPMETRQRTQVAVIFPDISLVESNPTDLFPPQYGHEPTSPPLVRSRRKPDFPVFLPRGDADVSPSYGYELASPPLVTRQRTQAGISFPDLSLVQSNPSDLQVPQYGYQLTTEPLTRNRSKPDLPAPLVRQDADLSPQYGYELATPSLVSRQRSQAAVSFPDISLVQSSPSDLPLPQYGYDLTTPAVVLARRRYWSPDAFNREDVFAPPPPIVAALNNFDFALYWQPRSRSSGFLAALAGGNLPPTNTTDVLRPIYGYELISPPMVARQRSRVAAVTATGVSRSETQPADLLPPRYGYELVALAAVRVRRSYWLPDAFNREDVLVPPLPVGPSLNNFDFTLFWQPSSRGARRAAVFSSGDLPLMEVPPPIVVLQNFDYALDRQLLRYSARFIAALSADTILVFGGVVEAPPLEVLQSIEILGVPNVFVAGPHAVYAVLAFQAFGETAPVNLPVSFDFSDLLILGEELVTAAVDYRIGRQAGKIARQPVVLSSARTGLPKSRVLLALAAPPPTNAVVTCYGTTDFARSIILTYVAG